MREIIVPSLGESVTEATIARWLKKKGDSVKLDEPLIELETDKVTLEVNASSAGVLSDIKNAEGTKVSVGDVVGLIDTAAAANSTLSATTSATPDQASITQAIETRNSSESESKTSTSREDGSSPAAKKIAAEKNLTLAEVAGSGRDGRVTKGDVLSAVMDRQTSPGSAAGQSVGNGTRYEERVKMTRLRQRIAERLKEAQNTAAMLTTFNEVDMTRLIEMRATYKDAFEKKHGTRLGFMSFFIAAAVQALKELPSLNAEIQGDEIVYKNYYDIGVAVAAPQGLVVPVVRNADAHSFAGIENEIVVLGQKAKNG
ncbi:MAG: 2-oxo acid dehydrogenase subunit E2, partial [Alphaproteobacteria bacterium]|nr:2-oxo acid dehydrogenase subunit E2 [Alphaproteobacteria bacterium]